MLYQPAHFRVDDRAAALALIRAHPLAVLVSPADGDVAVSHVPLVPRESDGRLVLLGHVARANPHWQAWTGPARVTAIFRGPDAYVSPDWYRTREAVPTWNYVVVHARGSLTVTHDPTAKERILKALIDAFDPPYRRQWDDELPEPWRERHKTHIVGFEIAVDDLQAKFKVSQNRDRADRAGVLAAMEERGDAGRALAAWMRRLAGGAG